MFQSEWGKGLHMVKDKYASGNFFFLMNPHTPPPPHSSTEETLYWLRNFLQNEKLFPISATS